MLLDHNQRALKAQSSVTEIMSFSLVWDWVPNGMFLWVYVEIRYRKKYNKLLVASLSSPVPFNEGMQDCSKWFLCFL